jgi:hypothetical protein
VIEEAPAATVTEPGTVKAPLLPARATVVATAAFQLRVTVQVLEAPAAIMPGAQVTEERKIGTTITEAALETDPRVAVTVAF